MAWAGVEKPSAAAESAEVTACRRPMVRELLMHVLRLDALPMIFGGCEMQAGIDHELATPTTPRNTATEWHCMGRRARVELQNVREMSAASLQAINTIGNILGIILLVGERFRAAVIVS